MKKTRNFLIDVQGTAVSILSGKDGEFIIADWLRNRNTVEFLGIWESVFNPKFNYGEFAIIKSQAGLNSYKAQGERLKRLNAIAIRQMQTLTAHTDVRYLGAPEKEKA